MTCRVVLVTQPPDVPMAPVDGKLTLVYWNICGLGQTIRMALALAGVDFVDARIDAGSPAASDYKQVWFAKKPEMTAVMPFPNLPYFMDGKVSLSQSSAILKYVGRKYGLLGSSGEEHVVDMALDQLKDIDSVFVRLSYSGGKEELKMWLEDAVPALLSKWEPLFASRKFLTGETFSVADLLLYETLRKIHIAEVELCGTATDGPVGGSTKLTEFTKQIEAVSEIKAYVESDAYLKRPLNNPHAKFT